MPWGRRYEIDIEQVESGGQILSASGGLRANIYNSPRQPIEVLEALRAGDRVEALVRARPPRNFLDPGAFDLHGYLARQKIDLIGSLRSGELSRLVDRPPPTLLQRLARARGNLLARLDALFAGQPDRHAVLRAMLLGDRTFVDSETVTAFQKTAAYHVLVVAGLHVGALAVFFFWLGRKLRLSVGAASLVTFLALAAYVGMAQDRPPILRAALMVALYLCARPFFRRVELLNTIALAALMIPFWKPSLLMDSSFELSFLAAGVIAALALPWMDRTSAPYREGLAHLGDVTRDIVHSPKVIQFRIEMRAGSRWTQALGNRAALGGDPVGHDADAGSGFSPREPCGSVEQYSRRDSHWVDRAARFSHAPRDVRMDALVFPARAHARVSCGVASWHREVGQHMAASFVSHSGAAGLVDRGFLRRAHLRGRCRAHRGGASSHAACASPVRTQYKRRPLCGRF
jgi:ComEC/Rec2-related protein